MMRSLSVTGLFAASILMAGCSSPTGIGDDSNSSIPKGERRDILLPFDSYFATPQEEALVFAATEKLTANCMQAHGVRWNVISPAKDQVDIRNQRRYGVLDMHVARVYGYHLPPGQPDVLRKAAEQQNREKGLTSRERIDAFGKGGFGGCARRAYDRLIEDAPEAEFDTYNRLSRSSFAESMKAGPTQLALEKWRACVRGGGYRFPDPIKMSSDSRWFKEGKIGTDERKAAVMDARCSQKSGLATIWMKEESKIQDSMISENLAYFKVLKKFRDVQVDSAWEALRVD